MVKSICRLVLPVTDIVDQHLTCFPVGGFFSPERTAVNPLLLRPLTNVFFTLPPEERDGRVLWRYLDNVLEAIPEELKTMGFRVKYMLREADLPFLRHAVWSCGNSADSSTFQLLGLSDDVNLPLPQGEVAIIQVKDEFKDTILARLSDYSGEEPYRILPVETTAEFDQILRTSRTSPLFETVVPLRESFKGIGTEGVLKNIQKRINFEGRIKRLEEGLAGRDPLSLSEEELGEVAGKFYGVGQRGKER